MDPWRAISPKIGLIIADFGKKREEEISSLHPSG
jgi:hypothetical protein